MPLHRAAFSLIAGLLLAVSLGLKAAMLNLATDPDLPRYHQALVQRLGEQGFAAAIDDRHLDFDFVVAQKGDCRLRLRIEPTADLGVSFVRASPDLPVRGYRYAGQFDAAFPRASYGIRSTIARIGVRLGLIATIQYPLAIGATPACDIDAIDFGNQMLAPRG
ncbi:MAG: hypothetical protein ACKOPQ_03895 [Novosphingobium sp.]